MPSGLYQIALFMSVFTFSISTFFFDENDFILMHLLLTVNMFITFF